MASQVGAVATQIKKASLNLLPDWLLEEDDDEEDDEVPRQASTQASSWLPLELLELELEKSEPEDPEPEPE